MNKFHSLTYTFMRIFTVINVLLITVVTCLQAAPGRAQVLEKRLSVSYTGVTLHEAVQDLQDKSLTEFAYTGQLSLDAIQVEKADFKNQQLGFILRTLVGRHGIVFFERDGIIFLTKAQQPRTISGNITDQRGAPISGATVSIKNRNGLAVSSDDQGHYRLAVTGNAQILMVSFMGYYTREITIDNRAAIDVTLEPVVQALDELVVIGYGRQQRDKITGSVGQLKAEAIKDKPVTSFDQAMAGRIAGVDISQSSGAPGGAVSITVRGTSSITGGNSPLIVIDGVPISSSSYERFSQGNSTQNDFVSSYFVNPLSSINPNDIESIEVLKDAAAAAIYGSRGSNGVILITTKKGTKDSAPQINLHAYGGLQQLTKKVDVMGAYEFADYSKLARDLSWIAKNPTEHTADDPQDIRGSGDRYAPYLIPYINGTPGLPETDWQDEIYRSAAMQNYELSVSGGTGRTRYYMSGNFLDQQGIIINSGLKRYGARVNMDTEITPKLRLGINFNPSFTNNNMVNSDGEWWREGVVISALMYHPNLPVRNPDGSFALGEMIRTNTSGASSVATIENPVALAELISNSLHHTRLLGNTYAELELAEGLKARTTFGVDLNYMERFYYRPKVLNWRSQPAPTTTFNYAWSNNSSSRNWLSETTLTYDRKIGSHQFNLLAGYSAQQEGNRRTYLDGRNFPNDDIQTLNAAQTTSGYSEHREWTLLSYLGRLTYDYDNRYLLMASIRRDGSSRFARNNKWGWFPSVSAGWRLSEESFFPDSRVLSDVKLRASYGSTGNTEIPYYGGTALLGEANYVIGDEIRNGLAPNTSPNANLSWETTRTFDAGIDIAFFHGKLALTADYYRADTEDLLLNVTVPGTSGFTNSLQNIGKVQNKGFEFLLSTEQQIGRDIWWSGSINFSANKNKVVELGPGQHQFLQNGGLTDPAFIVRVGEPIGSYFGYRVDGTFQTLDQFNSTPHLEGQNQAVGDFIYADTNGDGRVNADDRVILGDNNPRFTWGFANTLRYKSFDLAFNIQGKAGFEVFNATHRYLAETWGNNLSIYNSPEAPRPVQGVGSASHTRPSSWHVEDGSFIRLRNLTFGYTLPEKLLGRLAMKTARFYVSAVNPFTWTDYSGYNPEVSNRYGNAVLAGEDFGNYPASRTFSLGVNVTF
ncbi:SusC/RagA family TonB-linked outer membrane protein [Sphingobacterium haloxyli]|uniref:SusC/RagA family protein n=1 Tax=Sphingobacterium haloxyli TaxID=2100533 RepID=A0A2S9J062_9SPHI|nr:TonB-dependent receptor [Sphingobacterium haloxyli]PRD46130.1 SusC/RagA family protein [Sphingobacterium haloxyli]